MFPIFIATVRAGVRARMIQAFFILGVLLIAIAYLAASFSPRQPQTVALDIGISALRFIGILLSLLSVQETLGRDVDRKAILFLLSYPISRSDYLAGRFLGIIFLAGLNAFILALGLLITVLFLGFGYEQQYPPYLGLGYWITICGVMLEFFVVTAFALVISTLSTTPFLPISLGIAFVIAGRSLGSVLDYLVAGADGDKALTNTFLGPIHFLHWVMPDLSRLDWRAWALYGTGVESGEIFYSSLMSLSYSLILVLIAMQLFKRRQFT